MSKRTMIKENLPCTSGAVDFDVQAAAAVDWVGGGARLADFHVEEVRALDPEAGRDVWSTLSAEARANIEGELMDMMLFRLEAIEARLGGSLRDVCQQPA